MTVRVHPALTLGIPGVLRRLSRHRRLTDAAADLPPAWHLHRSMKGPQALQGPVTIAGDHTNVAGTQSRELGRQRARLRTAGATVRPLVCFKGETHRRGSSTVTTKCPVCAGAHLNQAQ